MATQQVCLIYLILTIISTFASTQTLLNVTSSALNQTDIVTNLIANNDSGQIAQRESQTNETLNRSAQSPNPYLGIPGAGDFLGGRQNQRSQLEALRQRQLQQQRQQQQQGLNPFGILNGINNFIPGSSSPTSNGNNLQSNNNGANSGFGSGLGIPLFGQPRTTPSPAYKQSGEDAGNSDNNQEGGNDGETGGGASPDYDSSGQGGGGGAEGQDQAQQDPTKDPDLQQFQNLKSSNFPADLFPPGILSNQDIADIQKGIEEQNKKEAEKQRQQEEEAARQAEEENAGAEEEENTTEPGNGDSANIAYDPTAEQESPIVTTTPSPVANIPFTRPVAPYNNYGNQNYGNRDAGLGYRDTGLGVNAGRDALLGNRGYNRFENQDVNLNRNRNQGLGNRHLLGGRDPLNGINRLSGRDRDYGVGRRDSLLGAIGRDRGLTSRDPSLGTGYDGYGERDARFNNGQNIGRGVGRDAGLDYLRPNNRYTNDGLTNPNLVNDLPPVDYDSRRGRTREEFVDDVDRYRKRGGRRGSDVNALTRNSRPRGRFDDDNDSYGYLRRPQGGEVGLRGRDRLTSRPDDELIEERLALGLRNQRRYRPEFGGQGQYSNVRENADSGSEVDYATQNGGDSSKDHLLEPLLTKPELFEGNNRRNQNQNSSPYNAETPKSYKHLAENRYNSDRNQAGPNSGYLPTPNYEVTSGGAYTPASGVIYDQPAQRRNYGSRDTSANYDGLGQQLRGVKAKSEIPPGVQSYLNVNRQLDSLRGDKKYNRDDLGSDYEHYLKQQRGATGGLPNLPNEHQRVTPKLIDSYRERSIYTKINEAQQPRVTHANPPYNAQDYGRLSGVNYADRNANYGGVTQRSPTVYTSEAESEEEQPEDEGVSGVNYANDEDVDTNNHANEGTDDDDGGSSYESTTARSPNLSNFSNLSDRQRQLLLQQQQHGYGSERAFDPRRQSYSQSPRLLAGSNLHNSRQRGSRAKSSPFLNI